MTVEENGWEQYQKLVLAELKRLSDGVEGLTAQMAEIRTELAVLKLKAGAWGVVAGMLPVLALILIQYLVRR